MHRRRSEHISADPPVHDDLPSRNEQVAPPPASRHDDIVFASAISADRLPLSSPQMRDVVRPVRENRASRSLSAVVVGRRSR